MHVKDRKRKPLDPKDVAVLLRCAPINEAKRISAGHMPDEPDVGVCPRFNPWSCPGPRIPHDRGAIWVQRTRGRRPRVRVLCAECSAALLDDKHDELGGLRIRIGSPRGDSPDRIASCSAATAEEETDAQRRARERAEIERDAMLYGLIIELADVPPGDLASDELQPLLSRMQWFRAETPRRPNWVKWIAGTIAILRRYYHASPAELEQAAAYAEATGEDAVIRGPEEMERLSIWLEAFTFRWGRD